MKYRRWPWFWIKDQCSGTLQGSQLLMNRYPSLESAYRCNKCHYNEAWSHEIAMVKNLKEKENDYQRNNPRTDSHKN